MKKTELKLLLWLARRLDKVVLSRGMYNDLADMGNRFDAALAEARVLHQRIEAAERTADWYQHELGRKLVATEKSIGKDVSLLMSDAAAILKWVLRG